MLTGQSIQTRLAVVRKKRIESGACNENIFAALDEQCPRRAQAGRISRVIQSCVDGKRAGYRRGWLVVGLLIQMSVEEPIEWGNDQASNRFSLGESNKHIRGAVKVILV